MGSVFLILKMKTEEKKVKKQEDSKFNETMQRKGVTVLANSCVIVKE